MRGLTSMLAFLVTLVVASTSFAHNPSLASLRLHVLEDGAMLELYVPTAGVESAFVERYGDEVPLDSDAGKERLVRYVQDNVEIRSPQGEWILGGGGILVGGHETVIRLAVQHPQGEWFPLEVHAPLFAENHGERVTFRFIEGEENTRVLLDARNEFSATLDVDPAGFVTSVEPVSDPAPHSLDGHGHAHPHAHGTEEDAPFSQPSERSALAWWAIPFLVLGLAPIVVRREG